MLFAVLQYLSMRLDQRSRCNKFFYAFLFSFRAHNHFHVFLHVVYSCTSFSSSSFFVHAVYATAAVAAAAVAFFSFIRYTRILRILKYIEAKNGQIHSKTVMRINSFRK